MPPVPSLSGAGVRWLRLLIPGDVIRVTRRLALRINLCQLRWEIYPRGGALLHFGCFVRCRAKFRAERVFPFFCPRVRRGLFWSPSFFILQARETDLTLTQKELRYRADSPAEENRCRASDPRKNFYQNFRGIFHIGFLMILRGKRLLSCFPRVGRR